MEESTQAYLCHVIIIEDCLFQVYLSQIVQISSTTAESMTIFKAYKDLENIFSIENTSYLPMYKDHDYAIDLVDDKQLFYSPIYSLSKNEPSIL